MAAPNIVSTFPTNNQTNVYINQLIGVTFGANLLESSVNPNTFLMYRSTDYSQVEGTAVYSSTDNKVTFTPGKVLDIDTAYTFIVVGADQSADCVKSDTLDSLAASEAIQFVTGSEVYPEPQPTPEEVEQDEQYAPSPTIPVLEPVVDPNFAVLETYPENGATNIGTYLSSGLCYIAQPSGVPIPYEMPIELASTQPNPSGFYTLSVKFNQNLWPSGTVYEDWSDWLTITAQPVNGDPSITAAVPSGFIVPPSGDTLYWTSLNTSGWHSNNEITVTISSDVINASGNLLSTDQYFAFTTAYDPLYCSVTKIRLAIGPYIKDIPDDTINRRIFENSIIAYQMANVTYGQDQWTMESPSFAAKMYTCCKTQYDLLNAKLLDRSCSAGQMKRLGDFTVQDPVDISKALEGPINAALSCMEFWVDRLIGMDGKAHPKMAIKGITNPSTPPVRGVRTWAKRSGRFGIPASNTRNQRSRKLPNIYSQWS